VSATIHSSAIVDPGAELATGVTVGPFATVGSDVRIGEGTQIGAGARIEGPTRLGSGNRVFPYACIGLEPQDLKFKGERTTLEVGDANHFREFSTVHRGTASGGGRTTIGSANLFMAYSHVAHDCAVGDNTVFANAGTLAGHVVVEDGAVIGAFSAVQQFCRVGRHAYIGGFSVITKDVLPFMRIVGAKPAYLGVNRIGLERRGFSTASIRAIEAAMRILLRSGLNTTQALERIGSELGGVEEVGQIAAFVRDSRQGVIKTLPGSTRSRGAGG
jgi:UDP-N-acetylglucosamine acyltransferase